jgi:NADPH-dependent 2,4-dienoyl-CoA reductase/sulfur reductase-like enzyme
MESLAARGVQLTVVEMGDRMVPRMMGPTAGGMIKDWCETKGVRVYTGAKVEAIEVAGAPAPAAPAPAPQNKPGLLSRIASAVGLGSNDAPAAAPPPAGGGLLRVRLSSGKTLEADLVINATGVKPNIGFLQDSGVACAAGVLTDESLQSNVPGVYAAGDCAEALDLPSGKRVVSAIQPNAADQARVAALNMAGQDAVLKRVTQINVLDTLGLISTSFGEWEGVAGGQHVELTDKAGGRHLSLQFAGDRLVGCNSVGWTEHVGVMRGLVEGKVALGDWKPRLMEDPTRLMAAYLARAQSADGRALVKA